MQSMQPNFKLGTACAMNCIIIKIYKKKIQIIVHISENILTKFDKLKKLHFTN